MISRAASVLPQFLDVGGDSREAVDAVRHAVLLEEVGAALEDLGHCGQKNTASSRNRSVDIRVVFTERFKVKDTMSEYRAVGLEPRGFMDKRLQPQSVNN